MTNAFWESVRVGTVIPLAGEIVFSEVANAPTVVNVANATNKREFFIDSLFHVIKRKQNRTMVALKAWLVNFGFLHLHPFEEIVLLQRFVC